MSLCSLHNVFFTKTYNYVFTINLLHEEIYVEKRGEEVKYYMSEDYFTHLH